jgi:hypothetical protein
VLAEIMRIGEKARAEALHGLSAEQRESMMNMLEHVRNNLAAVVLPAGTTVPPEREATATRTTKSADNSESSRRARRPAARAPRPRRRKASS